MRNIKKILGLLVVLGVAAPGCVDDDGNGQGGTGGSAGGEAGQDGQDGQGGQGGVGGAGPAAGNGGTGGAYGTAGTGGAGGGVGGDGGENGTSGTGGSDVAGGGGAEGSNVAGGGGTSGAPLLDGREFLLDSAQGYTVVDGTTIRLGFRRDDSDELQFTLSAGCNSMFGSFILHDGVVEVGNVGSTAMGCAPELHAQDNWLIGFLESGPSLELDGDRLTLTNPDAELSFIDREVANPDRALVGPTWTIDTLIDGAVASGVTSEPTVSFADDGTMQIHSTCNDGGGNYTTDNGNITFSGVSFTEKACVDPAAMNVEVHIMEIFANGTATYEIDAARLTIQHGSKGIGATTE